MEEAFTYNLSKRDQHILTIIIDIYTRTAEAVSSGQICKARQLDCSSATVRNVMLRLEELGFLAHPYKSSGKYPTKKAYDFFIRQLMSTQVVNNNAQQTIHQQLLETVLETNQLVHLTAKVLAVTSDLMAVAWITSARSIKLDSVQLIRLKSRHLLLIAHLDNSEVYHQDFDPGDHINKSLLEKVVMLVNEKGRGLTAGELETMAETNWNGLDKNILPVLKKALLLLGSGLRQQLEQEDVIMEGASNLISQPEFDNIAAARKTITAIEEKSVFIQSLKEPGIKKGETTIMLGDDRPAQHIPALSVISNKIFLNDGRSACLGIVGPRRMAYNRLVPLMDYTTTALRQAVGLL